ncbi:peptidase M20D [Purpureocillium lavendulum]|uniref:Peptidase M20D n=1 Tax=Purpureocillium lavendulum TaxID=1247861 RepID=A0AB34FSW8_9HYPO|nr:peptidase M20D [Purpureocillium lavendulum]
MDALPGIGHACGHNLIASASVLGAAATAVVMKKHSLCGKVVLYGTPAEEGGGGKIRLLNAGAYSSQGVDVSLISHPGIVADAARMHTTALSNFTAEYFGREAHAAANPWLGINALDGLVAAYMNVSMLRQQCMPGDIIQGHITDGGLRPNIIHAYAAGRFVIRADSQARLEELRRKVYSCFEAGATSSGAKLKITEGEAYKDHVANGPLARSYTRHFNALGPQFPISDNAEEDTRRGRTLASTDQGDMSYAMPSLSPAFAIVPGEGGQGPHNPEFASSAGTRDAFKRAAMVGKGLAGVAVDVLTVEGFLDEVKRSWREDMERGAAQQHGQGPDAKVGPEVIDAPAVLRVHGVGDARVVAEEGHEGHAEGEDEEHVRNVEEEGRGAKVEQHGEAAAEARGHRPEQGQQHEVAGHGEGPEGHVRRVLDDVEEGARVGEVRVRPGRLALLRGRLQAALGEVADVEEAREDEDEGEEQGDEGVRRGEGAGGSRA